MQEYCLNCKCLKNVNVLYTYANKLSITMLEVTTCEECGLTLNSQPFAKKENSDDEKTKNV